MNIVVLTAALSSLNSGLYSNGRVLRSLALAIGWKLAKRGAAREAAAAPAIGDPARNV